MPRAAGQPGRGDHGHVRRAEDAAGQLLQDERNAPGGEQGVQGASVEAPDQQRFESQADELVAVDQALQRLEELDERQARVVECRVFGGMSVEETAEALGLSPATIKRDWAMARAWLNRELSA